MTTTASPTNTASESVDSLTLTSGTAGLLKRGLNSKSTSGGDTNSLAQETGTHVDDAAFGIGADTISTAGFLADETSPDSVDEGDVGAARMALDRILYVRQVGTHGSRTIAAVSVTTSATALPSSVLTNRKRLILYNAGTQTVFLGTSGVTTSTGLGLLAGGSFETDGDVAVYGIVAATTCDVRVMEAA
jgi:hypothetical protein